MALVPFINFLENRGQSFGLNQDLCGDIYRRTLKGEDCASLLSDPALTQAGVGPKHLLEVRRGIRSYQVLEKKAEGVSGNFRDIVGPLATRWATRVAKSKEQKIRLESAYTACVAATLKRGRLRFHIKTHDDPRVEELAALSEHTEGCDELPPHRWFSARRGVACLPPRASGLPTV